MAWLSASPLRAQVTVGTEAVRERSDYHFDAPSSYDTNTLVPHFFEQHYVLDNLWVSAGLTYRAGARWNTSVAATPVRQALATDYDTFYDPGNIVWVAGTTGDAHVHSFRLTQAADIGVAGGIQWSGGYRLQMDVADFLAGDLTDTRNGEIIVRRIVTTAEHTNAQSHSVFVRATRVREFTKTWGLLISADLSPATVDRLTIQLPDKYPGQTLVYRAASLSAGGRVEFGRRGGTWPLALFAHAAHAWSYRSTQQATRSALGVGIEAGRAW